jgi:glucokinase
MLVGDIGGTNTRLARWEDGVLGPVTSLPSASYGGAEEPLRTWMDDHGDDVEAIALGVAGPVRDEVCVTTNLPWIVDGSLLRTAFGRPVTVINDFHAAARGVTALGPADRAVIVPGTPVEGAPIAVIGAGTGLGEAVVHDGCVLPGEGGHADFGPSNARELALSAWLAARLGRASWEDVVSGPGLVNLARFARHQLGEAEDPRLDHPDAAARVVAEQPSIVEWFCALYGAEAGNVALRSLARGGVYLCGGIAPRILPALRAGPFANRFFSKGKISGSLAGIPVYAVTHPAVGLLGAAVEAGLRLRR